MKVLLKSRFLFYVLAIYALNLQSKLKTKSPFTLPKYASNTWLGLTMNQSLESETNFIQFENFNNNTGSISYVVPNIFHYVNLNQSEIQFGQFLSILSVWLNHKPDRIYIHCDLCDFKGKYWDQLNKIEAVKSLLNVRKIKNFVNKIFGIKSGWIHHKSDVMRLLVLMYFGGIYLDNDMVVLKSLNKYRRFEIALGWLNDQEAIGNQIFIANKNARLLRAIYDIYR
jgi:hypothetical protein